MLCISILFIYTISSDSTNHSAFLFNDIVQYKQYVSQNILIENSPSRLYFSNHSSFTFLYNDNPQACLKENISALQIIADANNDPDLFFLLSTLYYFGTESIEPDIPLSVKYLSKASSMNHSLAQVLHLILKEEENGFDIYSFNQFYANYILNRKLHKNIKKIQFPYQQFYITNYLYYDYLKTNNSEQCLNILNMYGIERTNLHLIPNTRSNSSCYKVYKMFRHLQSQEAMNLIRSLSKYICFNETPYSDIRPIDDPYIMAHYISKYDCDLGIEFIRHSLQNHEALNIILKKAREMEKKQNLLYSLKLYKILSYFGIELAIENSIRISKILNLKIPLSIYSMNKLNEQYKKEKCISDIYNAIRFKKDILTSLSFLKHAVKLIPNSIFIVIPLRLLIVFMNFFISNKNSGIFFIIFNIIQKNIELSIFCVGILALAYLLKLRVELFFLTS